MMRKITTTVMIGLALLSMRATAANLLTDPGFDSQPVGEITWATTPWWGGGGGGTSSGGGGWITAAQSLSSPQSATLFLYGTDWAYSMAAQTLSSGITPGQSYDATASFLRTADIGTANAVFKVEWFNGSALLSADTSSVSFNNSYAANTWSSLGANFTAPAGANKASFEIVYGKAANTGAPGDIFIDNAGFAAVPEPSSIALLAAGGVALAGVARRKMRK